MKITIYDVVSGEIQRISVCPEPLDQLEEGEAYVEGEASPEDEYLSSGSLVPRPDLGVADEYVLSPEEVAHLSVPEGTEANCQGISVLSDDDGIDLSFADPGSYVVRLHPPFPYKPATIQVTVT